MDGCRASPLRQWPSHSCSLKTQARHVAERTRRKPGLPEDRHEALPRPLSLSLALRRPHSDAESQTQHTPGAAP